MAYENKPAAKQQRSYMKVLIPAGIIAVFLLAVAGLLPLPGQKDNPSPQSQPAEAGGIPKAEAPKGPPHQAGTEQATGSGTPGNAAATSR